MKTRSEYLTIDDLLAHDGTTLLSGPTGEATEPDRLRNLASKFARPLSQPEWAGGLIAICLPSDEILVATVTACLEARCPFLLLHPDISPERLAAIAVEAQPDLLVSDRRFPEALVPQCDVATLASGLSGYLGRIGPAHPNWAYAVATSGSTGRSKITVTGRDSLASHCERIAEEFELSPDDVVLQAAVPGFDVWIEEVLPTLRTGARLVCLPFGMNFDLQDFDAILRAQRITVVNLPVSIWTLWSDWLDRRDQVLPEHLRLVVVGSEPVPADAAQRWIERHPRVPRLVSAYGLSESTVTSMVHDVTRDGLPPGSTLVPLGRPLPGTAFEVSPDGELHLTGCDVHLGYLAAPSDHRPRAVVPSAGRLATGDLVRRRGSVLEFRGRADEQVKVRGIRISLAEVETIARRHVGVADAAAVARGDDLGRTIGLAVVVAEGAHQDSASLRALLASCLPSGYVPDRIEWLDRLPRLANNKIDKRSVAAMLDQVTEPRVEPGDPIAALMSSVLGRVVLPNEDFFAAGGHSLAAMRLLGRLDSELGVRLTVADLFEARTAYAIGDIAGRRDLGGAPPALPFSRNGSRSAPLSTQQMTVWLHEMFEPDSRAYHCQTSLELYGKIEPERLESAFSDAIAAHAIYRTGFHEVSGVPRQVVEPHAVFRLQSATLTHLTDSDRENAAHRLADEFITKPFDITRPPLIRALLIEQAVDEHLLVISEHHLVHDGYAFALLLRELTARLDGNAVETPPHNYLDYSRWQHDFLSGPAGDESRTYWRRLLQDPPPVWPASHNSGQGRASVMRRHVRQTAVDAARRSARGGDATLFASFMAALQIAIAGFSRQSHFCVGMAVANRAVTGTAEILGPFVNSVPVIAKMSPEQTVGEHRARVSSDVLGALQHQELPVTEIVKLTGRRARRNPLFQVLLGFDDGPVPTVRLGDAIGVLHELQNGSPKAALTIIAVPQHEQRVGLEGAAEAHVDMIWEHDLAAISHEEVVRIADLFDDALEAAATAVEQPLGRLTLAGERGLLSTIKEV